MLDIIVVNFRTPADLLVWSKTLQANLPTVPFTVTVVNVCPTAEDRTVGREVATVFNGQLLSTDENIGYGRACNLAARDGSGRYVLATNADVEFTKLALDTMLEAMEADSSIGVLGPRQVDQSGRLVHAGIFGTLDAPRHRAWKEPDRGRYVDVTDAVTVSGSVYLARRSCWEQLAGCPQNPSGDGPFLETPLTYEETWFSYHAQAHGWRVVYFGPVRMVHKWHSAVRLNNMDHHWEQSMKIARELFRQACDDHGIPHD